VTSSASPEPRGGPYGPPFAAPSVIGWTVEDDLVWHANQWCTRWHIFVQLVSGEVAEVVLYDVFPTP
jgi:hypothetical protein